jgi:hypothetical protein
MSFFFFRTFPLLLLLVAMTAVVVIVACEKNRGDFNSVLLQGLARQQQNEKYGAHLARKSQSSRSTTRRQPFPFFTI